MVNKTRKKSKRKKQKKTVLNIKNIVLLAVIIFLFAVLMDKIALPLYVRHSQEVEMPEIDGLSVDEGREKLEDVGFKLIVKDEKYSSHYQIGSIIKQNPISGSKVKKGRRVYVTISTGVRPSVVPVLIGESERDAIIKIEQAGLKRGIRLYEENPLFPADVVCYQSIPRDTRVQPGTKIDYTLSLGSVISESVVPDVRSLNADKAIAKIRKAGLIIGSIDTVYNEKYLPYTVIWQSLPPDTVVSYERQIFIKISTLNKPVTKQD